MEKKKKIVWLGTSVPYGSCTFDCESYVSYTAKKFGFELVPASVPGEAIHGQIEDGKFEPLQWGSTALSKAEYMASGRIEIQDEPKVPWQPGTEDNELHPGVGYNDYYRTWENIFNKENADADLFVFDVIPNNTNFSDDDWDEFDAEKWQYKDGSSFESHRTTFLGALLFLMDKMYAINPKAKMIMAIGCDLSYKEGKASFEKVSKAWNIPIVDAWEKLDQSEESMKKVKSDNGVNPHPSDYGHKELGKIFIEEFEKLLEEGIF